jgi:hypothetical protein
LLKGNEYHLRGSRRAALLLPLRHGLEVLEEQPLGDPINEWVIDGSDGGTPNDLNVYWNGALIFSTAPSTSSPRDLMRECWGFGTFPRGRHSTM